MSVAGPIELCQLMIDSQMTQIALSTFDMVSAFSEGPLSPAATPITETTKGSYSNMVADETHDLGQHGAAALLPIAPTSDLVYSAEGGKS